MTGQVVSTLLVALALVVAPGSAGARSRLRPPDANLTAPHPDPVPVQRGSRSDGAGQLLALAGAWDLLAACLRAGMAVPIAVRAIAETVDGAPGAALRRTAELLSLGADPQHAWQPALDCAATARLARAARRSGRSGTALAESLTRLAVAARAGAREQSEARAQRAGVLIAGPLGLCFLPAFLTVGVLPVVIGLATGLMQQW